MLQINKLKKYTQIGIQKLKNHLQTSFYIKTGLFLPKPLKIYYLITNKCNFKCKMCPQWICGQKEEERGYISTKRMKEIIDEMKKLKIKELGISGGEPLLYEKKLFELLEYANHNNIYTHFATNGSLLNQKKIKKYNDIGGGHISLSIDAIGEEHDKLRDYAGAYNSAQKILKIFKENKYPNINLKVNTVISNENLNHIINIANLAVKNKLLIFFQPFDPYDYGNKNLTIKQNKHRLWIQKENYNQLKTIINELVKLKQKNPTIILNDHKHLLAIYEYFTNPNFSIKCYAAFDQIAIYPQGDVFFCKFNRIASLKNMSLKQFLNSKQRKKIIQGSLKCKEGCLLGCMFRPSLKSLLTHGTKQLFKLSSTK